ncbi:glyoxal oxidase [Crassisporium funariophilum]|nr:glyoxal oxidase [Crassisporium funariophilum]
MGIASWYPAFCVSFLFLGLAYAQPATLPAPGQPTRKGVIGGFEVIGESLVSAQQLFVGTSDKVFIIDKVENNPTQIKGHPAWASEWALGKNTQRPMDAVTNSFCAGGNVLGNGTWLNVGGNQAVTHGGEPADSQFGGGPYNNPDGRKSIRMLTPCDDGTCDWILSPQESDQRWYPTLETLEDGTMIILGGCRFGGYVNDAGQDNPTYEFFPPRGAPITSPVLQRTLPANLFPLTWLLPSGKLLIQSNWATVLLDYKTGEETALDNIPEAVRIYPASAGTMMLPLTPANNWTATVLFCGGSNIQPERWLSPTFIVPTYGASTSCVKLTPDISGTYETEDAMPEARTMTNFIALPDGKVLNLNGAKMGTAGYGNNTWAVGHSYADDPVMRPSIYDPNAETGHRWITDGLTASTVPRMYHSSATLLPDGSVMVSGSNPNPDYMIGPDLKYPTEYRTELFYPSYYNERRPQPEGVLAQFSYGGPTFDITLNAEDLFDDVENIKTAQVVVIRTGFSTHSMNMGQRFVQLKSSYTAFAANNTATLHVSQLPPNPSIIAPGPAFVFVVVKGVPSVGLHVMLGSGQLGKQAILPLGDLPTESIVAAPPGTKNNQVGSASSISQASFGLVSAFGLLVASLVLGS